MLRATSSPLTQTPAKKNGTANSKKYAGSAIEPYHPGKAGSNGSTTNVATLAGKANA